MGEFATYNGHEIKIGTCENMYYLRADQARAVVAKRGNVDPMREDGIRFRFPWPDEDHVKPGEFKNHDRGLSLSGLKVPAGVEHGSIQFRADVGYLVSLECPESCEDSGTDHGQKIHRNGFAGAVRIVQQRWFNDRLVTVCACGGCGARYRLETFDAALPVLEALRKETAQRQHSEKIRNDSTPASIARAGEFYSQVAERIEDGYKLRGGPMHTSDVAGPFVAEVES